jgi:molecular chaperone GrpE (heat shock protein)
MNSDFEFLISRVTQIQRQLVEEREHAVQTHRKHVAEFDSLCLALIGIVDLLERLCLEPDAGAYLDKVVRKILAALKAAGVEQIVAKTVEPGLVRVLETRVAADKPNGAILEVCRKGYRSGERILRPIEVISASCDRSSQ